MMDFHRRYVSCSVLPGSLCLSKPGLHVIHHHPVLPYYLIQCSVFLTYSLPCTDLQNKYLMSSSRICSIFMDHTGLIGTLWQKEHLFICLSAWLYIYSRHCGVLFRRGACIQGCLSVFSSFCASVQVKSSRKRGTTPIISLQWDACEDSEEKGWWEPEMWVRSGVVSHHSNKKEFPIMYIKSKFWVFGQRLALHCYQSQKTQESEIKIWRLISVVYPSCPVQ